MVRFLGPMKCYSVAENKRRDENGIVGAWDVPLCIDTFGIKRRKGYVVFADLRCAIPAFVRDREAYKAVYVRIQFAAIELAAATLIRVAFKWFESLLGYKIKEGKKPSFILWVRC